MGGLNQAWCGRSMPAGSRMPTSQAHLAQERRPAAVVSTTRSASLQIATFPNFWFPLYPNSLQVLSATCRRFRFARLSQMTVAPLPDLQSDIETASPA